MLYFTKNLISLDERIVKCDKRLIISEILTLNMALKKNLTTQSGHVNHKWTCRELIHVWLLTGHAFSAKLG